MTEEERDRLLLRRPGTQTRIERSLMGNEALLQIAREELGLPQSGCGRQ